LASFLKNPSMLIIQTPNMALNLAPFGRWTLRDKAAQRRLALRWGIHPLVPLSLIRSPS
jgi:hypothetical protein